MLEELLEALPENNFGVPVNPEATRENVPELISRVPVEKHIKELPEEYQDFFFEELLVVTPPPSNKKSSTQRTGIIERVFGKILDGNL